MPYTPPSHRSPASSVAASPDTSRRPSFNAVKPVSAAFSSPSVLPPALPRSSSYLARHRRTPSAVSAVSAPAVSQPTPQATSEDLKGLVPVIHNYDDHSSVRQSPPPITGDRRGMPTGAVISPPDSPSSSDDEEHEIRGRQLEKMSELKQLHDAISQLPKQRRESSPSEPAELSPLMIEPLQTVSSTDGMRHSFSTSSLDQFTRVGHLIGRSSSSSSGRRVSHVRSATEPAVSTPTSAGSSLSASDEENDLEILRKPQMVRKKSGELVRPALRLGSRRRPSSMPGTPTFSKVVHFDSHLEHVRHFLQVDRPLAVSAGSSPVEAYDSETEYPFGNSSGSGIAAQKHSHRAAPYEWEIILTKFPLESPERKALPVRLERVWLSPDQKFLHGSIAVLNIAFSKSVVCRFTLDYWKTTSEIAAEYSAEIVPRTAPQGHDRFNFTIKLSDLANLESKTMFFCIRYTVDGKEFWDNNNGGNFQLDFKKKMPPANGKVGLQSSALPRSHRRANPSTAPRPVSMPASLDDFDDNSKVLFAQSVHDYLGESEHPALRLKSTQSALSLPSDNLAGRLTSPSGQAFANRYDFGASLTAAMQAAKDAMTTTKRDGLYMKSGRKFTGQPPSAPTSTLNLNMAAVAANSAQNAMSVNTGNTNAKSSTVALPIAALDRDSRAILAESGVYGPGSIASKSYDEIVSKYCFYVPKPQVPLKDGTSQNGQNGSARPSDNSTGELVLQTSPASTTASEGSPVQMSRPYLSGHLQQTVRHGWFDSHSRDSSSSSIASFESASLSTVAASTAAANHLIHSVGFPPNVDGTASSSASNSPASPASPATIVGGFASSYAGSPSSEFAFMKDRFPFSGTDGHSATAIKG